MDSQSSDQGFVILAYLMAGLIFYGGLGWLADRFLHTVYWTPIGLILGFVLAMYLVIKRYGNLGDRDEKTKESK